MPEPEPEPDSCHNPIGGGLLLVVLDTRQTLPHVPCPVPQQHPLQQSQWQWEWHKPQHPTTDIHFVFISKTLHELIYLLLISGLHHTSTACCLAALATAAAPLPVVIIIMCLCHSFSFSFVCATESDADSDSDSASDSESAAADLES
ncbi:GL15359 [Drosophila persimilis]|uniref:GL15359 n=1 Tax=Drosophila persimilis TaxID=7234 RepID=B4GPR2_DROPE|nr:GL15359 [Drosophila persimilis]